MKAFLAIDLPAEIKQQIEEQITPFKKDYPYMTWNEQDNYHIPVYSFEEVEYTKELGQRIEEAIFEITPFTLFALGVDLLLTNKIVVYMHFHKEKMLNALMKNIYDSMQDFEKKEKFPSIILAQYKVPSKQQYLLIRKKLQNLAVDIEIPVSKIGLHEIITGGKKPVYKKLAEFTLHD